MISDRLVELSEAYLEAMLSGDRREARRLVGVALDEGASAEQVLLDVFRPALIGVGDRWADGRASVAQEHYTSSETMHLMSLLRDMDTPRERPDRCVVTCAAESEEHGIGIRMVSDLFELAGWRTYHLGSNLPAYALATSIDTIRPDVVALSVTLPEALPRARDLIAHARQATVATTLFMVGGQAFDLAPEWIPRIGADLHAADARRAVTLADEAVGGITSGGGG